MMEIRATKVIASQPPNSDRVQSCRLCQKKYSLIGRDVGKVPMYIGAHICLSPCRALWIEGPWGFTT